MTQIRLLAAAALLSFGVANPSQAALIVEYSFTGTGAPNVVDPNATASTFNPGIGLIAPVFPLSATAAGWDAVDANAAIAAGDFWEFTVTAAPQFLLDLESITFENFTLAGGPPSFGLEIDNVLFVTSQATGGPVNIDLSSTSLQSSFTFRIAGFGAPTAAELWFIDNVQLNGTAVPEPSSLLLAGTLIPGYFVARRRRRAAKELTVAA
jgi:hypothetical protein